jgi:hypothetical protein
MKQETKIIMKEKVKFVDQEGKLVICNIELKDKGKGKLVFTMSGEYDNSSGQCFDKVSPRTPIQARLIQIWKEHHLNDMNAGTIEQEETLKDCKSTDYDERVKFLKKKRLYTVILKNGKKYEYGSAWLYRDLPKNLEKELKILIGIIKSEEEELKNKKIKESKIKSFEDFEDDKIIALAKSLEITPQEAEEITNEGNIYSYQGREYFVGTEEETRDEAKEYLVDSEMWEEAVKSGRTEKGKKDWIEEVIDTDGYGSTLNSYDGSEDTQEVNKTTYYVIRR